MVEGAAGLNRPHMVHLLQLTSWPLQGLPHPTAILSLIEQLTSTQMKCGNRRTVIMCRYGEDVCVWWSYWTSEVCVLVCFIHMWGFCSTYRKSPYTHSTFSFQDTHSSGCGLQPEKTLLLCLLVSHQFSRHFSQQHTHYHATLLLLHKPMYVHHNKHSIVFLYTH